MYSCSAGVGCVLAAAILETPVVRWMCGGTWGRALRWVVLANVVSAIIGVVPVFMFKLGGAPGFDVNPIEVFEHHWRHQLRDVVILFGVSVVIEAGCIYGLSARARAGVSPTRIAASMFVANAISYFLIAALVVVPDFSTGDFELRPDTKWLRGASDRVWFVDPDTSELCSIRLDGSERRSELREKLGRFRAVWGAISLYAICPREQSIYFVSEDRQWQVARDGVVRATGVEFLPESSLFMRYTIRESLARALGGATGKTSQTSDEPGLPGVFFSGAVEAFGGHRDRCGTASVVTTPYFGDGSGSPIVVTGADDCPVLRFGIRVGIAWLMNFDPVFAPGCRLVVFRSGDSIMVLDREKRLVGRLVRGDSFVLSVEAFERDDRRGD